MTFVPTVLGTGFGALALLNQTRDQQQGLLAASGTVARDLAAVRERLTTIQDADALLDDRQVLQVVLGSLGLEGDINNRGFLRNVLMSDLNDPRSTANRLGEPRYRELARMFNFAAETGATLPGASVADTLAPQLQALGSIDALFETRNNRLLTRALEVFDLQEDAGKTAFLQQVLKSDLSDPNALVNRLGDQRYIDFAAAFQNTTDRLPEVFRGQVSDRIAARLRTATTGAEITQDSRTLRAVLTQFGLEDQAGNPRLIEAVLDSDLSDPRSLANRLPDSRYQDLARAFDLAGRREEAGSVFALARAADRAPASLVSSDALLADDALLNTALRVFGLPTADPDKAFLKTVLDADPDDPASAINAPANSAYVAFAKAFDFGEQLARPDPNRESRIDRLIEAVTARTAPPSSVDDYLTDTGLFLATTNLFDLPQNASTAATTRRVLTSDPNAPLSFLQLTANDNYRNLFNALNLNEEDAPYSYPAGFEDAVINSYIARQFEVSVGQQNSDLRLMLALERDLKAIADPAGSQEAKWFRVIASPTLNSVFQGALGLPQSFGQLDIDRQSAELQARSAQVFGTSDLSELASREGIDGLQRRYLAFATISGGAFSAGAAPAGGVLSLLA